MTDKTLYLATYMIGYHEVSHGITSVNYTENLHELIWAERYVDAEYKLRHYIGEKMADTPYTLNIVSLKQAIT